MFEQADPSTFLHESAHFFLDMVVELEGQGQTALSADLDAIRKWVGTDDLLSVEAQEKFAEGFEQYLFEGTAPNAELRSAFRQFATWLRDVYRNVISNIGIMKLDINDEVRGEDSIAELCRRERALGLLCRLNKWEGRLLGSQCC